MATVWDIFSRQTEKLVVFHVEPGTVLSLCRHGSPCCQIIALCLASCVFWVGFKGQSHAQQFACVIFIWITSTSLYVTTTGQHSQKHEGSSDIQQRRVQPHLLGCAFHRRYSLGVICISLLNFFLHHMICKLIQTAVRRCWLHLRIDTYWE